MTSLAELQRVFSEAMQGGDSNRLLQALDDTATVDSLRGVSAYQNNIKGALLSAMAAAYPVCQTLLGDDFFQHFVGFYLQRRPLKDSDLNLVGEGFDDYLRAYCQQHTHLEHYVYIADVAKLERLLQLAYYAPPCRSFNASALAALSESAYGLIQYKLAPSIGLLQSEYDVAAIWQAHQHPEVPAMQLAQGEFYFLVQRRELTTDIKPMTQAEYLFLADIKRSVYFERLCEKHPDQVNIISEYIQLNIIDHFSVKNV